MTPLPTLLLLDVLVLSTTVDNVVNPTIVVMPVTK